MMRRMILLFVVVLPVVLHAEGLRILFMGDSITDGGWGRSGGSMASAEERNQKDLNHLYGHSFMLFCAAHFESRYPEREYQFFNRGISGYTLCDLHERWERDIATLQPDVLTILIGTNDVGKVVGSKEEQGRAFDPEAWEQSYRALLTKTRKAFPSIRLILCTPFVAPTGRMATRAYYPQYEAGVQACAEAVHRLAVEFQASVVDFHALMAELHAQQDVGNKGYWIWDGIHPTAAGHRRMADHWIEVATPLLQ